MWRLNLSFLSFVLGETDQALPTTPVPKKAVEEGEPVMLEEKEEHHRDPGIFLILLIQLLFTFGMF